MANEDGIFNSTSAIHSGNIEKKKKKKKKNLELLDLRTALYIF